MLRGLGFSLARRTDIRHQSEVHEERTLRAELHAHLPHRLEEWLRLYIADRTANFYQRDVGIAGPKHNPALNLIGDMWDDLNRCPKVVATTLTLEHLLIDLARGEVILLQHGGADEALVVAKVEIGFSAIVCHKHFAVLERTHGARVDIDVGIELQHGDVETARLEDGGERGGSNAFTQ